MTTTLTDDEAQLYDRQIRLWGLDGQQRYLTHSPYDLCSSFRCSSSFFFFFSSYNCRIKAARILIIRPRGLLTEVIKNIVLAGVHSVTLLDDRLVTAEDLGCQFFLQHADLGQSVVKSMKPRVQELNPRVLIRALHHSPFDFMQLQLESNDVAPPHSKSYNNLLEQQLFTLLKEHLVVCVGDADLALMQHLNAICRQLGIYFYAGASWGLQSWIFSDLKEHSFHRIQKDAGPDVEKETWPFLTEFIQSHVTRLGSKKNEKSTPAKPIARMLRQWRRMYPPLFYVWLCVMQFEADYGHKPNRLHAKDLNALLKQSQAWIPAMFRSEVPRSLFEQCLLDAEVSPVCAVVGGVWAQDIIHVVSGRHRPIRSLFLFDGMQLSGDLVA